MLGGVFVFFSIGPRHQRGCVVDGRFGQTPVVLRRHMRPRDPKWVSETLDPRMQCMRGYLGVHACTGVPVTQH